jgi:hypothetical protein
MHWKNPIKTLGLSMLLLSGVIAANASGAHASELQLLLNGKAVNSLNLSLEQLHTLLKAENGGQLLCTGGNGLVLLKKSEGRVIGTAAGEFTGCRWPGAEKTCTINGPGGVGVIEAESDVEVVMQGPEYLLMASNDVFATVYTEGTFCTILPEPRVGGTISVSIPNAEEKTTTHSGQLHAVKLGINVFCCQPVSLEGEVHITDLDPKATFSIGLI